MVGIRIPCKRVDHKLNELHEKWLELEFLVKELTTN